MSTRKTFKVSMLGDSSYQTLFETSPPDSLYGKMWKTKFLDKKRLLNLLKTLHLLQGRGVNVDFGNDRKTLIKL